MQVNRQKLLQELSELLSDEKVRVSMTKPLSKRIHALYINSNLVHKTNDMDDQEDSYEDLFQNKPSIKQFSLYQSIPLHNNINLLNKSKPSHSNQNIYKVIPKITANNQSLQTKINQPKQNYSLSKVNSKSKINYHTQNYQSKQKSQLNSKSKFNSCKSSNLIKQSKKLIQKPKENTENSREKTIKMFKKHSQNKTTKNHSINNCSQKKIHLKTQYYESSEKRQRKITHSLEKQNRNKVSDHSNTFLLNKSDAEQKIQPLYSLHESSKERQFLHYIEVKQNEANLEKCCLEEKIKNIKKIIDSEKLQCEEMNQDIKVMSCEINKKQINWKVLVEETHTIRKKSECYLSEVKEMSKQIQECSQQNTLIIKNLHQEKQLISMYMTVIEEMKSQLKIEKCQKNKIKKLLFLLKKNQQASISKNNFTEANTNQILNNVQQSINKWS